MKTIGRYRGRDVIVIDDGIVSDGDLVALDAALDAAELAGTVGPIYVTPAARNSLRELMRRREILLDAAKRRKRIS